MTSIFVFCPLWLYDFANVILGVETASTKNGENWNVSHEWRPAEAVWQTFQKAQDDTKWRQYVQFSFYANMLSRSNAFCALVWLCCIQVYLTNYMQAVKKMHWFPLSWKICKTKWECLRLFFYLWAPVPHSLSSFCPQSGSFAMWWCSWERWLIIRCCTASTTPLTNWLPWVKLCLRWGLGD